MPGSIREVPSSSTGTPPDTRRPYISRRNLTTGETAELVNFYVPLKMRNFDELQQRLAKGELISEQEMAEKYEPLAADERSVADWLQAQGLTIVRRDKNRLAVFAQGPVHQVAKSLQVTFALVSYLGADYTSAIDAPSVPATVAPVILGVNGLQPHLRAHKHQLRPASSNGNYAAYLPSQIAQAYQASGLYALNLTGAGQTIAIVMDTLPATSDLTSFWTNYGINQSLSNITLLQVVPGALSTDPDVTAESTLDTEWSSSIAPGAKVRVYATKDLTDTHVAVGYQQILNDAAKYGIHIVSLSLGQGEIGTAPSEFTAETQFFSTMAAEGITVFAASGDNGSNPDGAQQGSPPALQAMIPASNPYVTGVGATTLPQYYDTSADTAAEYGWSNSGGGISANYLRPSWQTGTGVPVTSYRCVPDVASVGDNSTPGVVFIGGREKPYGGTSLSTPTWAGFCALINQARANSSIAAIQSPVGLLGPHIYPLGGTNNFRDMTTGNNGNYNAGPGYDLVTGLGVPNVYALAQSLAPGWIAQPASVLHNFADGSVYGDGFKPSTGLVQGQDGNFYGTTYEGGNYYAGGIIYKVTPQGAMTILHNFGDGTVPNDGRLPGALVKGSDGNFYGTTQSGGTANNGTVFMLSSDGTTVKILHSFSDGSVPNDGIEPVVNAGLVQGSDGNFYGVTQFGGLAGDGTIFKITPQGAVTILHGIGDGSVNDEGAMSTSLIQGTDGNFYGTTEFGGTYGDGTIFKMTPRGAVTILHSFGDGSLADDGINPLAPLVQGSDGNFYGTTYSGTSMYGGNFFQMTPQGAVTILHSFGDGTVPSDGFYPQAGLIQGTDGNFYGTTESGGSVDAGTIFRITPQGSETILHNFADGEVPNDGTDPIAPLALGTDGNLYGTTEYGGTNYNGTIFQLQIKLAPSFTSPGNATFTTGVSNSFTVTATGLPAPTLSVSGLPSWASFNAGTGVLSGTPTGTIGQSYTLTFSAQNSVGGAASQTFTLNVQYIPSLTAPFITSSAPTAGGLVGTPYPAFTYQSLGAPAPTFSLSSGTLPPGLTLSSAGTLSGTPTQAGTFSGTVRASNGYGNATTQAFSINIQRAISFANGAPPGNLVLGAPYSFTYVTLGTATPTFSVVSGALPPGLTLSPAGVLSGTPPQPGAYWATVSAGNGSTAQSFTLNVQQPVAYADWVSNYPNVPNIDVPNLSVGNGLPNLLSYVYDIDPGQPATSADLAAQPVIDTDATSKPGTTYLTVTFRQYELLDPSIGVNLQTSSDLVHWQTVTPDISQQVGTDQVTGDPIMELGVKVTTSRLYLRLNVSSP